MLPNEVFALQCRDRYAEDGLVVDKSNGEFAHCPLPNGLGDSGYYLLHDDHQWQGLLQSRDVGRRCYYTYEVKRWLISANFVDGWFDLWDIYDEFNSGVHGGAYGKTQSEESRRLRSEAVKGERSYLFGKYGELHNKSRAVIATNTEGMELCYGGVREAARELGVTLSTLTTKLKTGKMVTLGKFKGWKFKYA